AAYLADYGVAMNGGTLSTGTDVDGVYPKTDEVLAKIAEIANLNLLIDEDEDYTFALLEEFYQRDLEEAMADLAYLEAELAIWEAVAADPSTIQAELDAVTQELAEAKVEQSNINAETAIAQLDVDQATDDLTQANTDISNYNAAVAALEDAEEDEQDAIDNIAEATAEIADLNTQLAPYEAALAAVEGPYNTALAQANSLLNTYFNAEAALNADPGNAAKITTRDNARTAFVDFAGDYIGTYGYTDAIDIKNSNALENEAGIGGTDFGDAKIDYDAEAANFAPAGVATGLMEDIEDLEEDIFDDQDDADPSNDDGYEVDLADAITAQAQAQADIDRLQSRNDDALANLDALEAAKDAASNVLADLTTELSIVNARVTNLEDLETSLDALIDAGGDLASIEAEIKTVKDAIEGAQEDVEDAEFALAENGINLEKAQAIIAKEEAKLAQLQAELAGLEALAAEYLALFNAAIAG
ncbi:MAG: hypothetical protein RLO12_12710, partial [Fulvivirga sp.]